MDEKMMDPKLIYHLHRIGNALEKIADTYAASVTFHQLPDDVPNPFQEPKIDLMELRERLAMLARDGFMAEVKALLAEYDVQKLSEVDEKLYEEIYEKSQNIDKKMGGNTNDK